MHKHKFKILNWNYKTITHSCKCGKITERLLTKEEKILIKKYDKLIIINNIENNTHYVWHKFCKYFKNKNEKWDVKKLIRNIHKWPIRYPDHISLVRVDDSLFANSELIFIQHKTKKEFMGTTVLFVGQCSGQCAEFFLYPRAAKRAETLLNSINKISDVIKKIENRNNKQISKEMNKDFLP